MQSHSFFLNLFRCLLKHSQYYYYGGDGDGGGGGGAGGGGCRFRPGLTCLQSLSHGCSWIDGILSHLKTYNTGDTYHAHIAY